MRRGNIYDRTNDLQRLIKRHKIKDNPEGFSEEVTLTINEPNDRKPASNIRLAADDLAQSLEKSMIMIGKLDILQNSRSSAHTRDISESSRQIINSLTQRVSAHKGALEDLSSLMKACGFPPNKQIFRHHEAVQTTLRSRIMEISKIFKKSLNRQLTIISTHQTPTPKVNVSTRYPVDESLNIPPHAQDQLCAYETALETVPETLHGAQIHEIEQAVNDLSEMMHEVAHLVSAQEGLVRQIDFNVEHSLEDVNLGNLSLERFADSFRSQQKWIIRILLFVFLSIMLFFAVGLV